MLVLHPLPYSTFKFIVVGQEKIYVVVLDVDNVK